MATLDHASLKRHWYVFAAYLALTSLFFGILSNYLIKDKNTETIRIFLNCQSYDEAGVVEKLSQGKEDYVKNIRLSSSPDEEELFALRFESAGLVSDLLVLSEKKATSFYCEKYFAPLDLAYLVTYGLSSSSFYQAEDHKNYGLLVESSEQLIHYQAEGTTGEKHYLFFLRNSSHIGQLNGSSRDGAMSLGKALLTL
jgi:hypothetical protein